MKEFLKEAGISVAVFTVFFLIYSEAAFGWVENLMSYWGWI